MPIFMLHRFADPERGVLGHQPHIVREHLAWLRRHGYQVLSLMEMIRRLREQPADVRRSIVLTVDDGYDDFRRIGWPVMAEFDCPVTVFLTSDFIDGRTWFWWDRIEFALSHTDQLGCTLDLGGSIETFVWRQPRPRGDMLFRLIERLKTVPESVRLSALEQIERLSPFPVPAAPPPTYAPLQWEDVRRLGEQGVTFGPHSVTHPILGRTDDRQFEQEIRGSWNRVRAETSAAVPVFCYPNGRLVDFSVREMDLLRRLDFGAAVATCDGYALGRHFVSPTSVDRFALPRYPWPETHEDFVQIVSGMERAKQLLRERTA